MYINIYKIIFSRKLLLKSHFLIKCLAKFKIHMKNETGIWKIYLSLKYIMDIILAVGGSLIIGKKYVPMSITVIILLSFIFKFLEGMNEYRAAFIFPFEQLVPISQAEEKRIYGTQLAVALAYNLLLDDLLIISGVYFFLEFYMSITGFLAVISMISVAVVAFVTGNLLAGKYAYTILINKVSILRVLQYIVTSGIIIGVCIGMVSGIRIVFYENIYRRFQSMEQLLDDAYVERVFLDNIRQMTDFGKLWLERLGRVESLFCLVGLVLTAGVVVIFLASREIQMIPMNGKPEICNRCDLYDIYYKVWKKVGEKTSDLFLLYQAGRFLRCRYLLVKGFLQFLFLDYECIAYIAIISAAASYIQNKILLVQLLMCMNLMVMATQCFELRSNAYAYFAISPEIEKLKLIKMSTASQDVLWKAKEKIFYGFLTLPAIVMFVYNIIFVCYLQLPLYYLGMILFLEAGCMFLMPQIQLHMIPMVTNTEYLSEAQIGESFEEDEIADKMQEFPRIFLVVIPIIISILMVFIQPMRVEVILYIELLYLIVAGFVLHQYMIRIRNRGVKNLFYKIK